MVDDVPLHLHQADHRHQQTHQLGDGEAPPHRREAEELRQQKGGGQKHHQLAHDRNDEGIDAVAEWLTVQTEAWKNNGTTN